MALRCSSSIDSTSYASIETLAVGLPVSFLMESGCSSYFDLESSVGVAVTGITMLSGGLLVSCRMVSRYLSSLYSVSCGCVETTRRDAWVVLLALYPMA
jgi:hypothetical protein